MHFQFLSNSLPSSQSQTPTSFFFSLFFFWSLPQTPSPQSAIPPRPSNYLSLLPDGYSQPDQTRPPVAHHPHFCHCQLPRKEPTYIHSSFCKVLCSLLDF
ncbi:hypothetical protein CPAR01_01429 [Colletotrichum paranaense]|uniref:Uncharacterized protein n=1 Tax=Colletotrichum paranaense TaxID=1914294 RepID=A0ABQ9T7Z9_9PEZI|nr:uncharacterized protein CPAR01_01429 [Colletotrichum paranaense]KAK1547462.1 hypothetical protein CPAR01_01429 [Colletotrichum paranaense]